MLVHVKGAKCIGIDAVEVTVEVDITVGIGLFLVGLADAAVKESILRTGTALSAVGFRIPGKKVVINLAPADLHKNGSGYDLPIAVGILAASGQVELPGIGKYLIMGELGLDGSIRDIPGALLFAELAMKNGFEGVILPEASALEAVEFRNFKVFGVRSLTTVIRILSEKEDCSDLLVWNTEAFSRIRSLPEQAEEIMDFAGIIGQEGAKRGVEIAAAGGHNLIMIGAPGSGKSSLAKAMSGILPPMTLKESLVTSKIWSISGHGKLRYGLMRERPFRSPHYSASVAALIGGGGDNILPGEVSLAQNGILFLDEFAQMPRSVIEALRSPIEDRQVIISRLKGKVRYPASFMLVAASNPCPCGYWGEEDKCSCSVTQRTNYLSKLSGPIMDRMDIHLWVHPVKTSSIFEGAKPEASKKVAERVMRARLAQQERFSDEYITTNSEMSNKQIEKYCPLSAQCLRTLESIMDSMCLSMRAYFRIIKVARTIADLQGQDEILPEHLLEAASFRFLDRKPQ